MYGKFTNLQPKTPRADFFVLPIKTKKKETQGQWDTKIHNQTQILPPIQNKMKDLDKINKKFVKVNDVGLTHRDTINGTTYYDTLIH